jgi:hypothetical protein
MSLPSYPFFRLLGPYEENHPGHLKLVKVGVKIAQLKNRDEIEGLIGGYEIIWILT